MKMSTFCSLLFGEWNEDKSYLNMNSVVIDIVESYFAEHKIAFKEGISMDFFLSHIDGQFFIYHHTADGDIEGYVTYALENLTNFSGVTRYER